MTTNFFKNIIALGVAGNWKFTISTDDNSQLAVSALFTPVEVRDNAVAVIPPMTFRGTAEELDEAFFAKIQAPVEKAAGLFDNMEVYMKGLEEAKRKSKMQQDKTLAENKAKALAKTAQANDGIEVSALPKTDKEQKRKIYEEVMKKITELNDACKYGQALELLPSAEEYPEKADELQKKKADLQRKQQQYTQALQLFNQA